MSNRERLTNRRQVENFEYGVSRPGAPPITYSASLGHYPDGRLAEVFLKAGKAGTDLHIQTQESAIAVSMALQYGCPAEVLRAAMPRTSRGEPEGAVGTLLDKIAGVST